MNKSKRVEKKDIEDIIALTPMQEGMLFHYLKDPQSGHYFEQLSLEISGEIDVELCEKSWNFVIQTNEMLRTVFRWEKVENPVQIVLKKHELQLAFYDFTDGEDNEKKGKTEEIKEKDRQAKFNLQEVPFRVTLCKIEEDRHEMIISNHHILYDGWSNGIILKEFFTVYNGLSSGKEWVKPVKTKFNAFVKWLQRQDKTKPTKYWQHYFKGFGSGEAGGLKRKKQAADHPGDYKYKFPGDIKPRLDDFVKEHGFTPGAFLYGAWGVVLRHYHFSDDIIFDTTVSGRSGSAPVKGIEDIVGLFAAVLPLRLTTRRGENIPGLLARIDTDLREREDFGNIFTAEMKEYYQDRKGDSFDSLIVIENYPLDKRSMEENGQLAIERYSITEVTRYDLTVIITLFDKIEVNISYNSELFDGPMVEKLCLHFGEIVEGMLREPYEEVWQLKALPEEERDKLRQKRACVEGSGVRPGSFTAPRDAVEERLAGIWSGVLKVEKSNIGIDTSFFDFGGHSLKVTILKAKLLEELRVRVPLSEIFRTGTIRNLSAYIKGLPAAEEGAGRVPVTPLEKKEYYPLSSGQKRAYILYRQDLSSTAYNGSSVMLLAGRPDRPRLEESFRRLIERHESLRTSFELIAGEPVQRIHEKNPGFQITNYKQIQDSKSQITKIVKDFIRPFDLSQVPPLRVGLVKIGTEKHLLVVDMHHIVCDGTSVTILIKDLTAFYRGEEPPVPVIQYKEFCRWQTLRLDSGLLKEREAYWLQRFEKDLPVLHMPTDFPRPGTPRFDGEKIKFKLGEDLKKDLDGLIKETGTTLYMVLLAVFNVLLFKYTGQEDIIVGSPIAGRHHTAFENIMGMFIESLPMRNHPRGDLPFATFLREVKTNTLMAFENQEYPLGEWMNRLDIKSDLSRNPLFDVMLIVQNYESAPLELGGLMIRPYEVDANISKLDFTLEAIESGDEILFGLEYRTQLFRRETMERFAGFFVKIIEQVTAGPGILLSGLDVVGNAELIRIISGGTGGLARLERDVDRGLVSELLRCHYRLQLGGIIHEVQSEDWGLSAYSRVTFDPFWNHTALLPGSGSDIPGYLEEIESFAGAHRRHAAVYLVAEWAGAGAALGVLKTSGYEMVNVESWMVYRADGGGPPVGDRWHRSGLEIEAVRDEKELTDHVGIFNDVYSIGRVYMGDALRLQFYSTEGPKVTHFIGRVNGVAVCIITLIMEETGYGCLYSLGTPAGCRKKGYAAAIVRHVTGEFLKSGGGTLFLQVDHQVGAERLYRRLGFETVFHRLGFVKSAGVIPAHPAEKSWRSLLDGIEEPTALEAAEGPAAAGKPAEWGRGRQYREIPGSLQGAVREFTAHYRLSAETLIMGAWGVLLGRYCGKKSVIFGTAGEGSGVDNDNRLLPMVVRVDDGSVVVDWLRGIENRLHHIRTYPAVPLLEIQEWSSIPGEHRLFTTLLEFENGGKAGKLREENLYGLVCRFKGPLQSAAISYKRSDFEADGIGRLWGHWLRVLEGILKSPEGRVFALEIITREEEQEILYGFNRAPGVDIASDGKTLYRLFEDRVAAMPDRTALVGLEEEEKKRRREEEKKKEEASVTYNELNKRSDQLALLLMEKGVRADTIVGIMVGRSIEMIIGILGILKAGGAYLPIDPDFPRERIDYMLKDSGAGILLTGPKITGFSSPQAFKNCPRGTPFHLHLSPPPVTSLAYIIYTSGSTGKPKGVLVEHRNVAAYLDAFGMEFDLGPEDTVVQQVSYTFDAFVEEMYPILLGGGKLAIPGREEAMDPVRLAAFICRHHVGLITCSPLMLDRLNGLMLSELENLNSIHTFISGGDVLKGEYIGNLLSIGRVYNTYGPTEATVCATYSRCKAGGTGSALIGKPISNYSVYILDGGGRILPVGAAGELCIGGGGVTRGYLNRPALTAERFCLYKKFCGGSRGAVFQKSPPGRRRQKIYKTGDLARWYADGNIEFLGRMDRQVKIRGFRIELAEIESRLSNHPEIKESVVLARTDSKGDKYLSAYIVSNTESKKTELSGLREYLSRELPGYMIPAYFIQMDKIPLTPGGKTDGKSLSAPGIDRGKNYVAPRYDIEAKLVGLWSEILNTAKDNIGIDDNFFHLGGHSLKATVLASRIHKELHIDIPLSGIFNTPHIRGLAAYIKESSGSKHIPVEPVEKKEYYPLSSVQRRLYILQQMDERGIGYNMPSAWQVEGHLDEEKFESVFHGLIRRHESLRTFFTAINEEPVQGIHGESIIGHWTLVIGEAGKSEIEDIIKNFIKPFDLSKAPLLRVELIKIDGQMQILMVDMHHIISDGLSIGIFVKEFMQLYGGKGLPALKLHYKDYSQWHKRHAGREFIKEQQTYWLKQFAGELPVLSLPGDWPRPAVQGFEGHTLHFEITGEKTTALKSLAHQQDVTLFMLLLSIYTVFLSKLSGQEDIVVGTPIAGRGHTDLEGIIGMFVNTLALRNFPYRQKTFDRFLGEIKEKTIKAFENRDYLYEDLLEQVEVERDTGRNPLFDTMFTLQNMDTSPVEIPGLKVVPYHYERRTSKFDLTLTAAAIEDRLAFTFEYCTHLFKMETMQRFTGFFMKTVSTVLEDHETRISGIEIITLEEKRRILHEFNDTGAEYPRKKTIHRLFEEQVEQRPHQVALVGFKEEEKKENVLLTYKELNKKSHRLAYVLKEKGVLADTIVGIMVGRSIEMIIGILGILKAGGAYLPIDPDFPRERIDYMLKDSSAGILLTGPKITGFSSPQSFKIHLHLSPPPVTSLAYVIYTSGTVGRPKGVMIDHHSVNRLVKNAGYITFGKKDRVLQTGALEFDASTFEIWGALLNGLSLYLENKENIVIAKNLKKIITTNNITIMWLTAPLFNRLVQEDVEIFPGPGSLLVGGDVLSTAHINQVRKRFPGLRIINGYGPTENTTFSTTFPIEREYRGAIPIGKPITNSTCYILDKAGQPQPIGPVGELYVGGEGLARGYLNNPQLTAERFVPSPFTLHPSLLYKTGDLARWMPDGNIQFLGRMDHQVKIRGFRIELGEIESRLLTHREIKEAVVLAREDNNEKYLCAYLVAGPGETGTIDPSVLRAHLSNRLPDYMVPSHFVQLDGIPLTANGKVDRKALPAPEIERENDVVAPRDDIEAKLVALWSGILGIEKEKIGIDANFFHLGGHSLKATVLVSRIHKELNVDIPLTETFKTPHIRGLAAYIKEAVKSKHIPVEAVEKKEYYPLSSAQRRLYILQRMDDKGGISYNMPSVWHVEGNPDGEKFGEIFRQLIFRHESLQTFFTTVNDEPVQGIHGKSVSDHWSLVIGETGKSEIEDIIKNFIKPFDLSRGPLLRVDLIKIDGQKYILMVDMHHIISDGLSIGIFVKEFMQLYSGKGLPALKLHYKDYSEWHNRHAGKEFITEQQTYWLKQFAGEVPVLGLPGDYRRPAVQGFEGHTLHFEMTGEETAALKSLAHEQHVTLFMLLLSIYTVFLSRLSGQEDIVVGTPIAGRGHTDLEGIIGMFVNTLALRNFPVMEKTFGQFLKEIKENTVKVFENQDYPYEDLVELVEVERDTSRNPLFDTVFVLQNMDTPAVHIQELKAVPYDYEKWTSKFDLTLTAVEIKDRLAFSFEYCTGLFKEETIRRFIDFFKKTVSTVLGNHETRLSRIEIITEEEKNRVLLDFNDTAAEYPCDKTIHRLFAEQAERTPGCTALIGPKSRIVNHKIINSREETHLTYNELNGKMNKLAYDLTGKGAGPGMVVGIMVGRCLEMAIGILGILKAGAAYLPLNPGSPPGRNRYMLQNSGADILLTEKTINEAIDLDRGTDDFSFFVPPGDDQPRQLAYVIYTSGSTGNPKGVPITHGNFSQLVHWGYRLGIGPGDKVIRNLSYYFDWSVWEMFIALTTGASLAVIGDDISLNPEAEVDFILKNGITVLHITPTQCRYLLEAGKFLRPLRYLIIGAEKLTVDLVEHSFASVSAGCRLFNMYGPTEATIISAVLELERGTLAGYKQLTSVPIGGPVGNTMLSVLDRYFNLCPIGVSGELHIGGDGLACGYLNNPGLTAERFVSSPITPHPSPIYKTGDMARWLPDGNIEFLGRRDHQVKIRGFRIELGEIENRLLTHGKIKEAIVLTREDNNEKYLCAYLVAKPGETDPIGPSGLRDYLADHLPDYMVPAYFVLLDGIPLTANGKVDRKALPAPVLEKGENYAAPRDHIEKKLVDLWSGILGVEKDGIGIGANFFHLGGHSLNALRLLNAIEKEFNVKIDFQDIFQYPTIAALRGLVRKNKQTTGNKIEIQAKKEYYELSYAQKRLWMLYQLDPANPGFNLPTRITLYEPVDETIMTKVLEMLVKRHKNFRTYFKNLKGGVLQAIRPHVPVNLETFDLSHLEEHTREARRVQLFREESGEPFNLETPPLFRVKLIKCKRGEFDVILNMHHIITDGWSMDILEQEFSRLYEACKTGDHRPPAPLKLDYIDYVYWERRLLGDREKVQGAAESWKALLTGELPALDLPYDFARKNMKTKESAGFGIVLSRELIMNLEKIAKQHNASLFMVLLAGFNLLLYRITGQYDILLAVPGAARQHEDLKHIVGFFVNTLLFKEKIDPAESFIHFLSRVKHHTLQVLEYQSFPLELLCRELKIKVPEISVFFNMSLFGNSGRERTRSADNYHLESVQESKFDIVCYLEEYNNGFTIETHYYKELFKPQTIERMMRLYRTIMEDIGRDPGKELGEYQYSLTGQKKKIRLSLAGPGG